LIAAAAALFIEAVDEQRLPAQLFCWHVEEVARPDEACLLSDRCFAK
jgi:hypothetical protein